MPEHVNITDPNLHEPKGVSSAAAGKVYVADGLGSGAWILAEPKGSDTAILRTMPWSNGAGGTEWVNHPGSVHGEIYVSAGAISVGPTGGTITADADYRAVGATWVLNPEAYHISLNTDNYSALVAKSGHYLLTSFVTFTTGAVAAGTRYAMKYRVNNSATLSSRRLIVEKVTAGADAVTMSGSALINLTAGDYINIMLASSVADTVSVTDAGLTLVYLHPF